MIPMVRNIKRYFSLKELAIVFTAIVISISAGIGVFQYLKKEVVIADSGNQHYVRTMKTTVGEVLEQAGITVSPDDYVNLPLDKELQKMKTNHIYIKRAVPISVSVDGEEITLMTYKDTVAEALEDTPIRLGRSDRLEGLFLKDKIVEDMKINIIRVKEEIISEEIPVPFKVEKRANKRMDEGKEKVVKEGKEGVREKQYKVVYENGIMIAKDLILDAIVSNPVNKLIEYGTIANFTTSRGETVRYKKVLDMKATAYTASFKDTGKHPDHPQFGITRTGIKAKKGVIAVDPKVIPLGTRVYVQGVGKVPTYGFAIAADTGGAVKGNKIDLYFDDQKTVDAWGVKKVKVYILED